MPASSFAPIAIVGQGCVLPGALTPAALWSLVRDRRSALAPAGEGLWRLAPGVSSDAVAREIPTTVGGRVSGFSDAFDAHGFALDAGSVKGLDPVFQWAMHAGREALMSAGLSPLDPHPRGTVVLGNLGYPTPGLIDLALELWSGGPCTFDARNRFMSGLPAHLLARALGFSGGAFALDAACASSLYAVKIACDRLHDGVADLALAGGVNHADDLFLHAGFGALRALSPSGQSRPFHRDADGLVPAEGAALLVLERLADAVAAGRPILGVIRGVGLSNDGRSRGLMVPAEAGQIRALRAAYAESGVAPSSISLVECHATGTAVGDGAEVRSMRAVFLGARGLPLGSLKSNLGHLVTASGSAAILKVLAALRAGIRPPTRDADAPLDELGDGMFRLLAAEEPWESRGPRRAAISNFGFGGNNAHLILEEWSPGGDAVTVAVPAPLSREPIAVIAQSVRAGAARGAAAFARAVLTTAPSSASPAGSASSAGGARTEGFASGGGTMSADTVTLSAAPLRSPPADLRAALPQQLLLLEAAEELAATLKGLPERTSVLVGMQCDAEVARHALRFRGEPGWVATLPSALREPLTAPGVVGCMPNIVANRLSHQLDCHGPSFTVSSEEVSGTVALELGVRALRAGAIDAAVVGAVDLACEPVQATAARALLPEARRAPGDAAVLLVLKRHADALRDGDPVLALLDARSDAAPTLALRLTETEAGVTPQLGHAHAASGLVHVAAAVAACAARALPSPLGPMPWLPAGGRRDAVVEISALGGEATSTRVAAADAAPPVPVVLGEAPRLGLFAADTREALIAALEARADLAQSPPDAPLRRAALRLAVLGASARDFEQRVDRAITLLRAAGGPLGAGALPGRGADGVLTLDDGILLGEAPLGGELAFVFTGAAGAYPHMGRDLALAFPELVDRFAARAASLHETTSWVYDPDPARHALPIDKLWGSSYLSQLHAELTRGTLELRPTASIGYCSGETNALFALGAWSSIDAFRDEVVASRVYERELCGELLCLRSAWGLAPGEPAAWSTWRVRAPVAEVRAALADEPRVHLVIVNAPADVVLAGEPAGCARVGARFGPRAARTPGYDFVMHAPEARPFESRWRVLHTRPTKDVPGVRFYTHATLDSYAATTEAAARALTGQAMGVVDFPALIERAYADGVRVFVEHGPHAGCTRWVDEVLGDRPHLAVPLDRYGQSSLAVALEAAARLFAAGVPVATATLTARLAPARAPLAVDAAARALVVSVPAHPEALPPAPRVSREAPLPAAASPSPSAPGDAQWMAPAPPLAPVDALLPATSPADALSAHGAPSGSAACSLAIAAAPLSPAALSAHAASSAHAALPSAAAPVVELVAVQQAQFAELHRAFLRQQVAVQQQFVRTTLGPLSRWLAASPVAPAAPPSAALTPAALTPAAPAPAALTPAPAAPAHTSPAPAHAPSARAPAFSPAPSIPAPISPLASSLTPPAPAQPGALAPRPPTGRTFTRADLETHASGSIASLFGPLFAPQDAYARQVRMPEAPLLLADRVIGLEGAPGTMGTGTIWTETDIRPDAFYLHEGRMPAGVLVESGQADLLLISWLGADLLNQGERVYRLLGCELELHGELPQVGDTLRHEIVVDGHAELDGIRIFFFHSDCWVDGVRRMSVRSGQAGFFTDAELARSAGVLWSAETASPRPGARVDPPVALPERRALDRDAVTALVEGRIAECFGAGFERAHTHTRTPALAGGTMRLLDEVTELAPTGGPWRRGYLRARLALTPDSWFFRGHFKNDPCMPGTLMLDGGLQAMQVLLTALGHTLGHDGGRFEPVRDEAFSLRCRGQATPSSKELVYEIFVEELHGGATPTLYADILCTVDGQKAFHCRRMGLRLAPAWPLDGGRLAVALPVDDRPVAAVDGFRFDYASLLASAWGAPSTAFGPMYARFDGPRRVARLPGPPYHFMSRVTRLAGAIGGMEVGSLAELAYDVPADAWYFAENGARVMPFCVMLETALQPCGWLASFVGGALGSEENLYFRNLDGQGTQHQELPPDVGTLTVTTTLTRVSATDGIVILGFAVAMRAGDAPVYTLETVFGFFPGDTMANQAGLPVSAEARAALDEEGLVTVDLAARPARYFGGALRLPTDRLAMLDRVTGLWPTGGKGGLGRVRADKRVRASDWFFKAHFFQDPVQPGSLGLEAMLQAVEVLAIELGLGEGLAAPRFEAQASGVTMRWKYRGQVVPENGVVVVDVALTELRREPGTVLLVAEGSLWVDGKRIYEASGLGVRVTSRPPR